MKTHPAAFLKLNLFLIKLKEKRGEYDKALRRKGTPSLSEPHKMSDEEPRLHIMDPPIQIDGGTWHVFNAYQLSKIGLDDQQIELLFKKEAKVTDFITDPQSAADTADWDTWWK